MRSPLPTSITLPSLLPCFPGNYTKRLNTLGSQKKAEDSQGLTVGGRNLLYIRTSKDTGLLPANPFLALVNKKHYYVMLLLIRINVHVNEYIFNKDNKKHFMKAEGKIEESRKTNAKSSNEYFLQ